MRHKPNFIFFDQTEKVGIHVLKGFFVDKKGFDLDVVRTLVVKYPFILGKDEEHLNKFFDILKEHGLTDEEIMKYLVETPKLISMDL